MDTNELKFLLKLLGCANYRSSLSTNTFKSFKGKDKICKDLGDRELVDYTREIATVKILPPGQALLKLDAAQVPITDKELKVLEKIGKASGKIAPSKISSLKASERDGILKALSERGLIVAEIKMKRVQAEVWLTQRGIEFLRDEYSPKKGSNPVLSLDLLNNYLRFLRKNLRVQSEEISSSLRVNENSPAETSNHLSDEDILQIIKRLDKELDTDNYLPIFHLRQKLQPPLSRDDLDKLLYRLEESNQIELSTLAEPQDYTPEQVESGIAQISSGPLFFITVN
ncbi:MAG: transcription factor RcaD [Nostoc sp. LLA-1]|nr:transcription factor RcaD [Cyanocohniella sp. LLY]